MTRAQSTGGGLHLGDGGERGKTRIEGTFPFFLPSLSPQGCSLGSAGVLLVECFAAGRIWCHFYVDVIFKTTLLLYWFGSNTLLREKKSCFGLEIFKYWLWTVRNDHYLILKKEKFTEF